MASSKVPARSWLYSATYSVLKVVPPSKKKVAMLITSSVPTGNPDIDEAIVPAPSIDILCLSESSSYHSIALALA